MSTPPQSSPPRQLSPGAKFLASLAPTIALLIVAEVVVRLTGAATTCPTYTESQLWTCDPLLYFTARPELVIRGQALNHAGFRSREFAPKPPGIFRVLAIGDSCTFGMTAPDNYLFVKDPYPQRLEQLIAERAGADKVEVLNGGQPGYNSYQGLLLLRTKLRNLHPDLITVRFGWNDHLMSPQNQVGNAFRELRNPFVRGVQDLLLHTALYPYAKRLGMEAQLWMQPAAPPGAPAFKPLPREWDPNVTIQDYEYNLRRIVELGRQQGAQVWLLTSPSAFLTPGHLLRYEQLPQDALPRRLLTMDRLPSFRRMMEIHDAYNAAVRAVGAELNIPVIDMAQLYRDHADQPLFSMQDILHPTQTGYDLEAEALYDRLFAQGIIKPRQ